MSTLLFLFITALSVAVGCYVGQKHLVDINKAAKRNTFSKAYFTGLNYLLNEQPDKAVDIFTKLVQVDTETIETHLALGSLFRRRGEIGRAIRIHQNLIARSYLTKDQRIAAMVALGKDYLHSGFIDRAERLFLEITSLGEQPFMSLHYLLDIYQQQKNWPAAIKVAQQLNVYTQENRTAVIAHYYCELAQIYLQQHQAEPAKKMLNQALKMDTRCVRANLMLGDIALQKNAFHKAIEYYMKIFSQDQDFFVEALPGLIQANEALGSQEELNTFIEAHLTSLSNIAFVLHLVGYYREKYDDDYAIIFLTKHLQQFPSLSGLKDLIQRQLESSISQETKKDLLILESLVDALLQHYPRYRCYQCGFKSNTLLWLCPGCKAWGSLKPV